MCVLLLAKCRDADVLVGDDDDNGSGCVQHTVTMMCASAPFFFPFFRQHIVLYRAPPV